MKTNRTIATTFPLTHEGGRASIITPEQELRRTVMACMLWEENFYESGISVAERIYNLVPAVDPVDVMQIAMDARNKMHLRHAPLMIVREMARHPAYRKFVADVLEQVIQRADEMGEFLAIYWSTAEFVPGVGFIHKKTPVAKQVKNGLARAFQKFNAYQLAKYNRGGRGVITLKDVLNICHPKPKNAEQSALWKQVIDDTLQPPDTWEVALSSGADKRETWVRLISENKLGGLATIRNLRNMHMVGVPHEMIVRAISQMNAEKVLPFRFIAAARMAPSFEPEIEKKMMECVATLPKMEGRTILLIDVSGSMQDSLSSKSDMTRMDAACGVAILAREILQEVDIWTFSTSCRLVPQRHGFALRDAIDLSQSHGGTYLGEAIAKLRREYQELEIERVIIVTDEQSHDEVTEKIGKRGYIVNVGSYKNGVGYGNWIHIDGFSESVLDYIRELESVEAADEQ